MLHRTGWLAGLLLLSACTVPLAHALQHRVDPPAATSAVEAWCDLCHQPFVAIAQARTALPAAPFAAPLFGFERPGAPAVYVTRAEPRGPPTV